MTTDLLYIILKNHLLAEIAELKEVAFYQNQDEESNNSKGRPVVNCPAVLIEFRDTRTRSLGRGWEETDIQFQARVLTSNLYDDDKRITESSQLNHFAISRKVFIALKGFSAWLSDHPDFTALKDTEGDYVLCNSLSRSNYRTDSRLGRLMRTIMDFSGSGKDKTAVKTLQTAEPDLDIKT